MKGRLLTICCVMVLVQACGGSSGSRSVFPAPIIGSGVIVSETRPLASFHSVALMAHAEVHLVEGGIQNVRIEADDNIIGHIRTTVSGGALIIDADAEYDSTHGVEVYLEATDVRSLDLAGVGLIDATSVSSIGTVRATLTGVGTISLAGVADTFNATHAGVGTINAESLEARLGTIVSSGIGQCRVYVTEVLNVTISGIGDVYYAGDPPTVNSTITGTGQLIKL